MVWVTNMVTGVHIFARKDDVKELPRCEICGQQLPGSLTWTIVNGIARCECGAEYICYHHDEKGKLLEKEPHCLVPTPLIPKYRSAWESSENKEEFWRRAKTISDEYRAKPRPIR